MNRDLFTVNAGGAYLQGIAHIPSTSSGNHSTGIIFLHGWSGYRTGPHDMFVKFAERLAEEGYYAIRFDFRGSGYSPNAYLSEVPKHIAMADDIDAIVKHVTDIYDIKDIILLGICSGAKIALYYTFHINPYIKHIIALSSPPLNYKQADKAIAIKSMAANGRHYGSKILDTHTWQRLFSGDIDIRSVWRIFSKPLIAIFSSKNGKPPKKAYSPRPQVHNFTGEVLLIHGEKDPETEVAIEQIGTFLNNLNIKHHKYIIKDANHSYYAVKWEEEIYCIISNWLLDKTHTGRNKNICNNIIT